jgi:hypothetical protein
MAQTGFTPISLYYTATAAATPTAGNLVAGELAINTADGKLFYKDSAGVVQTLASKGAGTVSGSTGYVQFNTSGALNSNANFFWDNTNSRLGINTITPTVKLDVNGGIRAVGGATFDGTNGYSFSGTGDTDGGMFSPADGTVTFATNNVERVRINATGDVGIGTNSPLSKLQVNGIARIGGVGAQTTLAIGQQGTGISIEAFQDNTGTTKRDVYLAAFGGNVGIGTTSPAATLTVNGNTITPNLYFGATSSSAGTIGATSTGGGANITMYGSTASPVTNTFIFNTSSGEQARLTNSGFTAKSIFSASTQYGSDSNFDVTGTSVTLANLGFIDMANYSGFFVINNYSSGGVTHFLVGGGTVTATGNTGATSGMTVTFNAPISGYTIQNLTGSTVTIGIFKVRTRPNA